MLVFVGCQPTSSGSTSNENVPILQGDITSVDPLSLLVLKPGVLQSRNLPYQQDPTVSYCEVSLDIKNGSPRFYSGFSQFKAYPSASISKVFLTAWALSQLGPKYKFTHEWRLVKYGDGSVDAYLDSNNDPIFNIEKVLFAIMHLRRYGITEIRNLYLSTDTRVYLSVLANPHIELKQVPMSLAESVDNLKLIFNSENWGSQTEQAKLNLQNFLLQNNKKATMPERFNVRNVIVDVEQNKIQIFKNATVIKIESAPLKQYLKEINVNSNNYVSDALFKLLGGEKAFLKFQSEQLALNTQQLIMRTGSGLPLNLNGQRLDNTASCYAIVKAMHFIKLISDKHELDMGHLLLTAGLDVGTYVTDLVINQSVVLKTGRLYDVPTLNLAGVVATKKGLVAFAFLGHDFDNSRESEMKQKRDYLLQGLMSSYQDIPYFSTLKLNEVFVSL